MACRLSGAKPLPEPMLLYCKKYTREQTSVTLDSKRFVWNCRLRNGAHLVQGELSLYYWSGIHMPLRLLIHFVIDVKMLYLRHTDDWLCIWFSVSFRLCEVGNTSRVVEKQHRITTDRRLLQPLYTINSAFRFRHVQASWNSFSIKMYDYIKKSYSCFAFKTGWSVKEKWIQQNYRSLQTMWQAHE